MATKTDIIPEPTYICAECGREIDHDHSDQKLIGGVMRHVCHDQYLCEPTMEFLFGAAR